MNVLNNVTAALILVSFSQLPAAIKPKNGAAVMSFRMFVSDYHRALKLSESTLFQ